MAFFDCVTGGGSLSNATISGLQTGATSTTLSITMPSDGIIFGCGVSSDYPNTYLNGTAIAADGAWFIGSTVIYTWAFKAPKGSTVTFSKVRYYTVT